MGLILVLLMVFLSIWIVLWGDSLFDNNFKVIFLNVKFIMLLIDFNYFLG